MPVARSADVCLYEVCSEEDGVAQPLKGILWSIDPVGTMSRHEDIPVGLRLTQIAQLTLR